MSAYTSAAPCIRARSMQARLPSAASFATAGALMMVLGGCGGGSTAPSPSAQPDTLTTQTTAGKCAPNNPYAGAAAGTGSLDLERKWVRLYMTDAYLWYNEMPALDAALPAYNQANHYASLSTWFQDSKSRATTPSGARRDKFSFTYPTAAWNALSQSGVTSGYGFELYMKSPKPPRGIRVATVQPESPAANAGVSRGDTILSVTPVGGSRISIDAGDDASIAALNTALFSPAAGSSYGFEMKANSGQTRIVTLTAGDVTQSPVLLKQVFRDMPAPSKPGYLVFNDFILPGEGQLKQAFTEFRNEGVTDLILDLRYNGGGYLFMSSQLAYMIAGSAATANKVFEKEQFNDKRAADTNSPNSTTPFFNVSSGISGSNTVKGSALPELNLKRLFVIASSGTCSASEALINSLRGIDIPVYLIGDTTCGKPYGFTAQDNCGISYFPIEFKGVNAKGFGDYSDGFAPNVAATDDLEHPLGAGEAMVEKARACIQNIANCQGGALGLAKSAASAAQQLGVIQKGPERSSKILIDHQWDR